MNDSLTKSLKFVSESTREILRDFPENVRRSIGTDLRHVQYGKKPTSSTPMKNIGSGIMDIVIDYDKETYRCVYIAKLHNAIWVLHAFHKKSKTGIKTPQKEINTIKRRLKQALEMDKTVN